MLQDHRSQSTTRYTNEYLGAVNNQGKVSSKNGKRISGLSLVEGSVGGTFYYLRLLPFDAAGISYGLGNVGQAGRSGRSGHTN